MQTSAEFLGEGQPLKGCTLEGHDIKLCEKKKFGHPEVTKIEMFVPLGSCAPSLGQRFDAARRC